MMERRMLSKGSLIGSVFLLAILGAAFPIAIRAAQGNEEPRQEVLKLADAFARGTLEAAQQQAGTVAQNADLEDFMNLLRTRAKKGLGIGSKPGAIKPDGIEALIVELSKRPRTADQLRGHAEDLVRAAYVTAAIGAIAREKCPVKSKQGQKDPEKWRAWSEAMQSEAIGLADAFHSGNPSGVKQAASKLNSTCNACHAAFRD